MIEAQGDILGHRQGVEKIEVLEYHADAEAPRGGRIADRDGRSVPADLALIGTKDPVDDFHQGAFPGAVLAQQGVDPVGGNFQIDAIVGERPRIAFADPAQFEQRYNFIASGRIHGLETAIRTLRCQEP